MIKTVNLETIDDKGLVESVKKERDDVALKELMTRHTGLYMSMVNKIIDNSNQTLKNDILEQKAYNFYTFALDYNPEKNMSFATYLGERTKFLCFLSRRRSMKDSGAELSEDIPSGFSTTNFVESKDSLRDVLSLIDGDSDPRFKKIINMRFFSEDKICPWRSIAKEMDMSIEGVRKIYHKHIGQIKKKINKKKNE